MHIKYENGFLHRLGIKDIVEDIKQNEFTGLVLCNQHPTIDQLMTIANSLKTNTSITYFNLSHNDIGDAGTSIIGDLLKKNNTITNLDLSMTNIGDTGLKALVEGLKDNEAIYEINLMDNDISYEGVKILGEIYQIRNNVNIKLEHDNHPLQQQLIHLRYYHYYKKIDNHPKTMQLPYNLETTIFSAGLGERKDGAKKQKIERGNK